MSSPSEPSPFAPSSIVSAPEQREEASPSSAALVPRSGSAIASPRVGAAATATTAPMQLAAGQQQPAEKQEESEQPDSHVEYSGSTISSQFRLTPTGRDTHAHSDGKSSVDDSDATRNGTCSMRQSEPVAGGDDDGDSAAGSRRALGWQQQPPQSEIRTTPSDGALATVGFSPMTCNNASMQSDAFNDRDPSEAESIPIVDATPLQMPPAARRSGASGTALLAALDRLKTRGPSTASSSPSRSSAYTVAAAGFAKKSLEKYIAEHSSGAAEATIPFSKLASVPIPKHVATWLQRHCSLSAAWIPSEAERLRTKKVAAEAAERADAKERAFAAVEEAKRLRAKEMAHARSISMAAVSAVRVGHAASAAAKRAADAALVSTRQQLRAIADAAAVGVAVAQAAAQAAAEFAAAARGGYDVARLALKAKQKREEQERAKQEREQHEKDERKRQEQERAEVAPRKEEEAREEARASPLFASASQIVPADALLQLAAASGAETHVAETQEATPTPAAAAAAATATVVQETPASLTPVPIETEPTERHHSPMKRSHVSPTPSLTPTPSGEVQERQIRNPEIDSSSSPANARSQASPSASASASTTAPAPAAGLAVGNGAVREAAASKKKRITQPNDRRMPVGQRRRKMITKQSSSVSKAVTQPGDDRRRAAVVKNSKQRATPRSTTSSTTTSAAQSTSGGSASMSAADAEPTSMSSEGHGHEEWNLSKNRAKRRGKRPRRFGSEAPEESSGEEEAEEEEGENRESSESASSDDDELVVSPVLLKKAAERRRQSSEKKTKKKRLRKKIVQPTDTMKIVPVRRRSPAKRRASPALPRVQRKQAKRSRGAVASASTSSSSSARSPQPKARVVSFAERTAAHEQLMRCSVGSHVRIARDIETDHSELRIAEVIEDVSTAKTRRVRVHYEGLDAGCDETIALVNPRLRGMVGSTLAPIDERTVWVVPTSRSPIASWGSAAVGLQMLLVETKDNPEEAVEVHAFDADHHPSPYNVLYLNGPNAQQMMWEDEEQVQSAQIRAAPTRPELVGSTILRLDSNGSQYLRVLAYKSGGNTIDDEGRRPTFSVIDLQTNVQSVLSKRQAEGTFLVSTTVLDSFEAEMETNVAKVKAAKKARRAKGDQAKAKAVKVVKTVAPPKSKRAMKKRSPSKSKRSRSSSSTSATAAAAATVSEKKAQRASKRKATTRAAVPPSAKKVIVSKPKPKRSMAPPASKPKPKSKAAKVKAKPKAKASAPAAAAAAAAAKKAPVRKKVRTSRSTRASKSALAGEMGDALVGQELYLLPDQYVHEETHVKVVAYDASHGDPYLLCYIDDKGVDVPGKAPYHESSHVVATAVLFRTHQAEQAANPATLFNGMRFLVTGVEDDEVKRLIGAHGGEVISSLNDLDVEDEDAYARAIVATGRAAWRRPVLVVIADPRGYRRAKHVFAVAMGLPVLHPDWVRTSCAQRELLSWRAFELPVGFSSQHARFVFSALPSNFYKSGRDAWKGRCYALATRLEETIAGAGAGQTLPQLHANAGLLPLTTIARVPSASLLKPLQGKSIALLFESEEGQREWSRILEMTGATVVELSALAELAKGKKGKGKGKGKGARRGRVAKQQQPVSRIDAVVCQRGDVYDTRAEACAQAQQLGVPLTNLDWVMESLVEGSAQNLDNFVITPPTSGDTEGQACDAGTVSGGSPRRGARGRSPCAASGNASYGTPKSPKSSRSGRNEPTFRLNEFIVLKGNGSSSSASSSSSTSTPASSTMGRIIEVNQTTVTGTRIRWELLRMNRNGSVTETGEEGVGSVRAIAHRIVILNESDYAKRRGLHSCPNVMRMQEVREVPNGSQDW